MKFGLHAKKEQIPGENMSNLRHTTDTSRQRVVILSKIQAYDKMCNVWQT